MTFENLNADHECDCLSNTRQDTVSEFAMKINKDSIREQDFQSKWEKGQRDIDGNCVKICSLKGNSVSVINQDNREQIFQTYKSLFKLSPGYKPNVLIFKFYEDAGLLKFTPSKANIYHYDFYKSDDFDHNSIVNIEIQNLH